MEAKEEVKRKLKRIYEEELKGAKCHVRLLGVRLLGYFTLRPADEARPHAKDVPDVNPLSEDRHLARWLLLVHAGVPQI